MLFVLVALSPRGWGATGVIALAVVGVGARIEAAVLDAARHDAPARRDDRARRDDAAQP